MDLLKYTVTPTTTIKNAIKKIGEAGKKVVFVVDDKLELLGIFTDGDMRRYVLSDGDLNEPVTKAMNQSPITFKSVAEAERNKKFEKMLVYPIVSPTGKLEDALFWNDQDTVIHNNPSLDKHPIVIIAGGKGTRLYPYTKILPKPLIPIGDVTITERIIDNFLKYHCTDFRLILNYKKNMIKSYFNDLDKKYTITYHDECDFLGTGGGLSLLKGSIHDSFFVTNCDILVNDDYASIMNFHKSKKNKITFVCAMKNYIIPYGVVKIDNDGKIIELSEKPSFSYLTNTGFYVLEPDVIDNLVENEFIHLPDIAQRYINQGENVGVYPVAEDSWLDMGQFQELEQMYKTIIGD